jgi:AcrR family transcriptional regulator
VTRQNYHHGTLRETLLSATLTLIAQEGIGAVSLRKVARTAGVSPGAPYHHFEDRAALLTALSDEGFKNLEATLKAAKEKEESPPERIAAMLTAYIRFAQENPAYYRLMFRPELKTKNKEEEDDAGAAAYKLLTKTVEECQTDSTHTETETLSIALWSTAHGLASLWLDGQLNHQTDNPATVAKEVTKLIATLANKE